MQSSRAGHRRPLPAIVRWTSVGICAAVALLLTIEAGTAFTPWWVQNHREIQLWSGPDSGAISFGRVPAWSYFMVVAPQQGGRLHVFNPATRNYAYIDASAVGPSGPPPSSSASQGASPDSTTPAAGASGATGSGASPSPSGTPARQPPRLPAGYQPWWVANFVPTELWSGPSSDSASLGPMPQFRVFMVVESQRGDRLRVWSPEKDVFGYLDSADVGPSGPSVWMRAHPVRLVGRVGLPGRSVGNKSYVRNLPALDDETELRHVPNNTPLQILDRVAASDGVAWFTVEGGGYIRASEVRLPRPTESHLPGRWIDADLTEPAMVTAYEGDRIVYSALAIKGTAAFTTPTGTFKIWRRVENETMDSETLAQPIPRSAPGGYYLKDVLYTQYFTYDGASLHYNYWLGTFGYAGSHGCLGLNHDDAKWLWDWASTGTPVVVR